MRLIARLFVRTKLAVRFASSLPSKRVKRLMITSLQAWEGLASTYSPAAANKISEQVDV
jgi:hypothetical protein